MSQISIVLLHSNCLPSKSSLSSQQKSSTSLSVVELLNFHSLTISTFVVYSLKNLDRKKQKQFRGAHPTRYQADVISIPSTVRSKTINNTAGVNTNTGREVIRELIERKSQASHRSSYKAPNSLNASQRFQALSTRSSQRP